MSSIKQSLINLTSYTKDLLEQLDDQINLSDVEEYQQAIQALKEDERVIDRMQEDLKQVRTSIKRLEEIGFSKELMEIYIYKKSNVNLGEIRKVLYHQKQFLEEAFKELEDDST